MKQYFSKTKRRWIDLKPSDRLNELIKYKYRIRDIAGKPLARVPKKIVKGVKC